MKLIYLNDTHTHTFGRRRACLLSNKFIHFSLIFHVYEFSNPFFLPSAIHHNVLCVRQYFTNKYIFNVCVVCVCSSSCFQLPLRSLISPRASCHNRRRIYAHRTYRNILYVWNENI